MTRIERNTTCPCGSGVKFKKCCYTRGIEEYEDFEIIRVALTQLELKNRKFNVYSNWLVGNPIISAKFKNTRGILVGDGFYVRDSKEVFQEFLIHQLKHGLGWKWGAAESTKDEENKHIYLRWLADYAWLLRERTTKENQLAPNLYSTDATGQSLMLLHFAYDIFTLRNASELPNKKIKELRKWDKFQSTRYEIAVAAIFVRAGFHLEWFDDAKQTDKHGEFRAIHRTTGERIIVEVKSRYRDGTYHQPGKFDSTLIKTGAKAKLDSALEQLSDTEPNAVFIDLNLPMKMYDQKFKSGLTNELLRVFDDYPEYTAHNKSPYNSVVFTNWSWHFFGNDPAQPSVTTVKSIPLHPKHSLSSNVINLIDRAIDEYGQIPHPVFV